MPKHKKKKKKNPSGTAVAIVLGVVGVGALVGWQVLSDSEKKKKLNARGGGCPPRPGIPNFRLAQAPAVSCSSCSFYAPTAKVGVIAVSTQGLCTKYDQSVGPLCLCDAWAPAQEYGLTISADCTDFVIKNAPDNFDTSSERQAMAMFEVVDAAVKSGLEIDPFALANSWFSKISPAACSWPPTTASSARITNLYIYLTTVLAMMVIDRGGSVFGVAGKSVEAAAELDQKIIERAATFGLVWNPAVIPDLLPGADGPLGSLGPIQVFEATPSVFVQTDGALIAILSGNNLKNAKFRLFDPAKNLEATILPTACISGNCGDEDSPQLGFQSPGIAEYTLYFRHVDDSSWTPTNVVIKTRAANATLAT